MARPTPEETKVLLTSNKLTQFCREHLFVGTPYVFEGAPDHESQFSKYFTSNLKVPAEQITIVGSGKIGYSLDPDAFPRAFLPSSDIDVIVVSEKLFDDIWGSVLDWHYPRYYDPQKLPSADYHWMMQRRRDIYWGYMVPSDISFRGVSYLPKLQRFLDIKANWFETFQKASSLPGFSGRTVNSRLYRTWAFAEKYQVESLRQLELAVRKLSLSTRKKGVNR